MSRSLRRRIAVSVGSLLAMVGGPALTVMPASADRPGLDSINHIVVIYEENHSFDNLYGGWEGVNGRANVLPANTIQVGQNGVAYQCLKQDDVNLAGLSATCTDTTTGATFTSHFTNAPFNTDAYIPASDTTCPIQGKEFTKSNGWLNGTGTPGGCTRDLVHKFYQEIYQLNGGQQNRYVTGSDAVGLVMGYYDTTQLPIYRYLHADGAPHYAIADDFFQSAFGGSFLNHQWLIAARTPTYPGAPSTLHSVLDANGFPTSYPLYTNSNPNAHDRVLTQLCGTDAVAALPCGDSAVNTMQPTYQPHGSFGAVLPPQTGPTIGDELSANGVSWAWYSGGWSNADGDSGAPGWTNGTTFGVCADPRSTLNGTSGTRWYCPDTSFQFHHQPFNYFVNYAPGTSGRAHLQDEQAFLNLEGASGKACRLNSVSFIKPLGVENEHPGYASESAGSDHLVSLLKSIENSACRKDTMVVVTYDEFGGQWDHVSPPGQRNNNGPHDEWGPGTRIPALVISPHLRGDFVVDNTQYDTTSILATIEHRYGLASLGSRDAAVNDLTGVFNAKSPFED